MVYIGMIVILMKCFVFAADFQNGWQIISPGKSFAVYAATSTEKAEWMAHISKCITDLIKKSMIILFHSK